MQKRLPLMIVALVSGLSACVVKPKTVKAYDEQCQMETHSVVLEMHEVDGIGMLHCNDNQDCKAALIGQAVGVAIALPLSALISSTIAMSSNSYYWLSERAECKEHAAQASDSDNTRATHVDTN